MFLLYLFLLFKTISNHKHSYQINEKLKKDVCGCVCRRVKIEFHESAVFSSATKGLTKFTLLLSPQHKGS